MSYLSVPNFKSRIPDHVHNAYCHNSQDKDRPLLSLESIESFYAMISENPHPSDFELFCPLCLRPMTWTGYVISLSHIKSMWGCACGYKLSAIDDETIITG